MKFRLGDLVTIDNLHGKLNVWEVSSIDIANPDHPKYHIRNIHNQFRKIVGGKSLTMIEPAPVPKKKRKISFK